MFIASLQSIPSSDLLRGFLSHSFDVGSICVSSSQAITLDQSVAVNLQTNTLEEMDGKRYKENVIGFFSPSGMYKIRPSILDRLTQSCFPTIPINLLQLFHGVNQLQPNSVNIYFSPLSSVYREVHIDCSPIHSLLLKKEGVSKQIGGTDGINHITLIVEGDFDQSTTLPLSLPIHTDNQLQQLTFACRTHSILRYYYGMYTLVCFTHTIEVINGELFLPVKHGIVQESCIFLQEKNHLRLQTMCSTHCNHVLFVSMVFVFGFPYVIGDISNPSNLSIFRGQPLLSS